MRGGGTLREQGVFRCMLFSSIIVSPSHNGEGTSGASPEVVAFVSRVWHVASVQMMSLSLVVEV